MSAPVIELATRAAAVGLDPWRVLRPGAQDERLIIDALAERLEGARAVRAAAHANLTAARVIDGLVDILEVLGLVERKAGAHV